jgi:hypothetical protein
MATHKPSDAAVRVATAPLHRMFCVKDCDRPTPGWQENARIVLAAAHDPVNFEDPMDVSVRLGDVVEALRERAEPWTADFLLRTFGGDRA